MKNENLGIGSQFIIGIAVSCILSYLTLNSPSNQNDLARIIGEGLGVGTLALIASQSFPKYGAATIYLLYSYIIIYKP